jgi:hypothetical protein
VPIAVQQQEDNPKSAAALNLSPEGKPLSFRTAIQGPNSSDWFEASDVEFSKLLDTKCIHPIHQHELPVDRRRDVTYYNQKIKEKYTSEGEIQRRVRGTAGGDRINYPGDVSAYTAEMEVVKIHWHSVVSDNIHTHCTRYMTADIHDFYLGAPLERPEYVRIPCKQISHKNIEKYNLTPYIQNESVLFEINKCLWGLPQAGILSQKRLVTHLAKHGYRQPDQAVPCYFKHDTNNVSFTLVVDDFGIKYSDKSHAQHLIDTIQLLYPQLKVDWTGAKYLNFTLDFDMNDNTLAFSMPNYIPKALERFRHGKTVKGASSPELYIPHYSKSNPATHQPQQVSVDNSPPLNPDEIKLLQQIVGVYLYYARAVDPTMLTAVNHIASLLSTPTKQLLEYADRLIAYSAAYPNHKTVFKGCDMILFMQSDASYLTRSSARSVAGGLFYLGNQNDHNNINGLIYALSLIIDTVCSSVAEAEYASLFICGKQGTWFRTVLAVMGYPQPAPTPILCDNSVAVGIANNAVKLKHSKAIDMRYHWIRDQIKQGKFNVYWQAGSTNHADFFTKALTVRKHQDMKKAFVSLPPPNPNNPSLNKRANFHRANRFHLLTDNNDDDTETATQ